MDAKESENKGPIVPSLADEPQAGAALSNNAMPKVFISYRHVDPDQGLARALATFLSERSLKVFLDTQMLVGTRWVEEIDVQLRSSQYFVVLLSRESIESDMVRKEVQLAHELAQQDKLRILPVRVDFADRLPYDLGAYLDPIQYDTWAPGEAPDPVCGRVLAAIQQAQPLPGQAMVEDAAFAVLPAPAAAPGPAQIAAPLPVADPRLETGTLKPGSPFYVKRAADKALERSISRGGVTVVIKAPRQFGKSSLLARAHALATAAGHATCYLDFQLLDEEQCASLDTLCRLLAAKLARAFKTVLKPAEVWDDFLGPKESLEIFLEDAVLKEQPGPVTLCLDEVDRIFDQPYREDFFATIRAWHNRRAIAPVWERLQLFLVHSTEPTLWIQDINISPFNVGERLRLEGLQPDQVADLNARHGAPLRREAEVAELCDLVGGQPYLVRQALYLLATKRCDWAALKRQATNDRGPFGDHLRGLIWAMRKNPTLCDALRQVLRQHCCDDELDFERLLATGLVQGNSRRQVTPRCPLYEHYFNQHL